MPPVLRRRHGPRRAPARRRGRVVPQPLRADAVHRRPGASTSSTRRGDGHDRVEGQHPRRRPRRQDPRARGGPLPVRARRRARHRRPDRLRRRAHRLVHRPPEDLPGHRRAARLRLLAAAAVPALPARVGRRSAGADRGDHRRRADDDARLQRHPEPRDLHGSAGGVRPGAGDARRDADPLGRRLSGPPRGDAARRHRRRRALVRHRPLLRVPPDERVRGRRARSCSTSPASATSGGTR